MDGLGEACRQMVRRGGVAWRWWSKKSIRVGQESGKSSVEKCSSEYI